MSLLMDAFPVQFPFQISNSWCLGKGLEAFYRRLLLKPLALEVGAPCDMRTHVRYFLLPHMHA
jgi:hypothetical protein